MKRRITPDQLMELTEEQQNKLRDMWEPTIGDSFIYFDNVKYITRMFYKMYGLALKDVIGDIYSKDVCLPLLDIGQMMEMLNGHNMECVYIESNPGIKTWEYTQHLYYCKLATVETEQKELCDCLWQAIKAIL